MQLFGSTTSPFVRRLRMWLANDEFEFVNLDIFCDEGRAVLKANNPALKIPMLKDGDLTIFDSRQIYRYLNQKLDRETLDWADENDLTLLDAANDSLVELLLLSRSGIAMDSDLMFVKLQQERVADIMELLETKVTNGEFVQWRYPAICLFCLLDWVDFRQLHDTSKLEHLNRFRQLHLQRTEAIATDPR